MTDTAIPENLSSLNAGEESVRQMSLDMIERDEELSMHLAMIHRVMDLLQFHRQFHEHKTDDEQTVMLLGFRIFNAIAAAIRLSFSGYYQSAGLQLRDMLETGFLLGYFSLDITQVKRWRDVDETQRQKEFKLVKIREALDAHNGFTERRRHKHYKELSEMAGHPTFVGLEMLRPESGADAQMGPFFAPRLLTITIHELAKVSMIAYESFQWHWTPKTLEHFRAIECYLADTEYWVQKVFGREAFDQKALLAIRANIVKLEEQCKES